MPTTPILFILEGSARHEVLLIDTRSTKLDKLTQMISSASANSPNCAEFMSKYKKGGDKVGQIKVKWSTAGRDQKVWPASTIVTDDNFEAVMRLIEDSGVGKDVFEVKLEKEKEGKD